MSTLNKPLNLVPDRQDIALFNHNRHPALLTERLWELVPLLRFVGAKVREASPEKTVITIPLLESSMNQNGTQQAAVFYLLADYTLGVGIWAALPGTYTVGIHDRCEACPVQFWLKNGYVEHKAPGSGEIRGEVEISPEAAHGMRSRLAGKGRTSLNAQVRLYQGDTLIAIAHHDMGIYIDLPRQMDRAASASQVQKIKTSALMIAALRDDSISKSLAGEQGAAIAQRMAKASPQLPALIRARTEHCDRLLDSQGDAFSQVLVLGVGVDTKSLRYAGPKQAWFMCDLREMLRARRQRLAHVGQEGKYSRLIPVDFRMRGWHQKLLASDFDPLKPTLVILEGVSMYLDRKDLRQTSDELLHLLLHPSSLLWIDHVSDELLQMPQLEVKSFLTSMSRLGEPFITGFSTPNECMGSENWFTTETSSAASVLGDSIDPVYQHYLFSLMGTVRSSQS